MRVHVRMTFFAVHLMTRWCMCDGQHFSDCDFAAFVHSIPFVACSSCECTTDVGLVITTHFIIHLRFIRTPLPNALNRFKYGNTASTPSIPCTRSCVPLFLSLSWRYCYHVVDTLALDRIYHWHDFTYTTCTNVAHSNDGFVTFASFSADSYSERKSNQISNGFFFLFFTLNGRYFGDKNAKYMGALVKSHFYFQLFIRFCGCFVPHILCICPYWHLIGITDEKKYIYTPFHTFIKYKFNEAQPFAKDRK